MSWCSLVNAVGGALQDCGNLRIAGRLHGQFVARLGSAQLRLFAGLDDQLCQFETRRSVIAAGLSATDCNVGQVELDHPLGDRAQ